MAPTEFEQSIHRTIAWFSVFSYPVTAFEIWKWLHAPGEDISLEQVYETLEQSHWLACRIQASGAFYTLADFGDIEEMVALRHERFLDALRKYRKLKRAAAFFSLIPSVQAVAAGNTLSWWHTRPQSDIDLFIITRPGTIWATRAILVFPFALLGKRPSIQTGPNEKIDTFCFSFFVTEDALDIKPLAIKGGDPYLAYWTKSLVPVLDRGRIFEKFEKENAWTREDVPNAKLRKPHRELSTKPLRSFPLPMRYLESFLCRLQRKKFPESIRSGANQDSRIVVNNRMLKFHANDRRQQFREQWRSRIGQVR